MALDYDFWINAGDTALGFNLAISKDRPYERATAQFRKDQLDTAASVGDQSLTGWWTRGQLSFHKGAGLSYYEVAEGETVFERYNDSDSIDVSTPGKASLIPAVADLGIAATDAVPAPLKAGGGVYALTGTGVKYTAGVSTSAIATSDSGVPSSITSSGSLYYLANAAKIEKQFDSSSVRTNHVTNPSFEVDTTSWSATGTTLTRTNYVTNPSFVSGTTGWTPGAPAVRTNLITNPSFEAGTAGWTAIGGTLDTQAYGDGSGNFARVTTSGTQSTAGIVTSSFITVSPSATYALQARWRAAGTNLLNDAYPDFKVEWYDSSNTLVYTNDQEFGIPAEDAWVNLSLTVSAPATAAKAKVTIYANRVGKIPSGYKFTFDKVLFEQASQVYDYFDGDTPDTAGLTVHAWTGTAQLSTSTATYPVRLSADSSRGVSGAQAMRIDNAWAGTRLSASRTVTGLTPGTQYRVVASCYAEGSAPVRLLADSTLIGETTAFGEWNQLSGVFTATATSHTLTVTHDTSGTPGVIYVDAVLWTEAPWDLGYFDGDTFSSGTLSFAWSGAPNASTSIATDTSPVSLTATTTQFKYGKKSMRVVDKYGRLTPMTAQATLSGLTIGTTYQLAAYLRVDSGGSRAVAMSVDSGAAIATTATPGGWERLAGTFTATTTSHVLKFAHTGSGNAPAFYVDAVLWTETPYFGDYFDGSLAGATWAGTPNASKSTYTGVGTSASVALWQNTSANWDRVWWAKGRLWAVDVAGYWYTLSTAGGTVTQADAFWNSRQTGVNWSLAEGTGPVYISDGFSIYAITVSTDGLVPSISTPTTVAMVPLGEQVSTIGYYLGYLVIATTRGVRVAQVQADGSLVMGPLVIKGDFANANRLGMFDTHVYVVGRPAGRGGAATLCSVDLGYFVSELVPAWSPVVTLGAIAPTKGGATVASDGRVYSWSNANLKATVPDALSTSGYILTGSHRFGTLDAKLFRFVRVRTEGAVGSISVSAILPDGTEHTVGSVPAGQSLDLDMASAAPDPVEYVALRFTLTGDGTAGPTLLGYQLKSLPVPKRQRMIRVPLMLFDGETNRRGQVMHTDPWDRLSDLEALEASSSIVTFSDTESGETGSAYIESVEVSRETPPGPGNGSVGGFIYVTLRKVS